jgi:hypothetical protein
VDRPGPAGNVCPCRVRVNGCRGAVGARCDAAPCRHAQPTGNARLITTWMATAASAARMTSAVSPRKCLIASTHAELPIFHPERRSRLVQSRIDMTWLIEDFLAAALRAFRRPSPDSFPLSASTVHAMNVSTSRPIECARFSASTNIRGLTQSAHRREFSYPIPRSLAEAAPLSGCCLAPPL